jgi:hypothetical protein
MYVYYCTRFSQQEVGKFIYTHTRSCIGKCTIKTTNQQQQQHVYTLCGQSGLLLQDIL